MTLGTSLFLIAVGAILRFAVTVSAHGFNIHTVGVILMIVGIAGLVISLAWMSIAAGRRRAPVAYTERDVPPAQRVPPTERY